MNEETLDPRRQKLMTALYGELSQEEEREFQDLLAQDPALRADWDELRETRTLLAEGVSEETAPDFVFLDPEAAFLRSTGQNTPAAPSSRFRAWFRQAWTRPAWGFAATTAVLVVLILTGFRMNWVENGVVFRFGSEPRNSSPALMAETVPVQTVLPEGIDPRQIVSPEDGVKATPVGAHGSPVTRNDLDYYSTGMMQMMSGMLSDYRNERNGELAYILRGFYEQIRNEQKLQYDDLKARVEGVGLGLMAEQSRANARLESLVLPNETGVFPSNPNPSGTERGENHDQE